MLELNSWARQAMERLNNEAGKVSGNKEKAMSKAVLEAIKDFCKQDAEFAQAVVQGGSFADCMAAVAKGVGNAISDIEAYRKAVSFYFPGAKIKMQMSIDLIGDAADAEDPSVGAPTPGPSGHPLPRERAVVLDLADFF